MTTEAQPLCTGRSSLFDATDLRSHQQARAFCAVCPAIAACRDNLRATKRKAAGVKGGGPEGTWAGQLHKPQGKKAAA